MPTVDVIVIGNGIAGSSVKRAAERVGLSAYVIDARKPYQGSKAALGFFALRWFEGRQYRRVCRSLALYRGLGLILAASAEVSAWNTPLVQHRDDYYVIDVSRALVAPDREAEVTRVDGEGCVYTADDVYSARKGVAICAGAGAAAFGVKAFSKVNYGATLNASGGQPADVRSHRVRPFFDILSVYQGGRLRIGSSTAKSPQQALVELDAALPKTPFTYNGEAHYDIGLRSFWNNPVKDYDPDWLSPNVVCMAGLGRVGYALAPAVAEEIVERWA